MNKSLSLLIAVLILCGCASVSSLKYKDYDCTQIAYEKQQMERQSTKLYHSLKMERTTDYLRDLIGVMISGPAYLLFKGDGPAATEYAQLKGEYEALQDNAIAKKCRLDFQQNLNGDVYEGPYVDGKRHGQWVLRFASGGVEEGPYVDGKRHGQWVLRKANGDVGEGPYVDGKEHGQWVLRAANGDVGEGPYVDGKAHGQWVGRTADGDVAEGPVVDGKKHGPWVERFADGKVREGTFVDGKQRGQWKILTGADK